jgi:hypothetical protein
LGGVAGVRVQKEPSHYLWLALPATQIGPKLFGELRGRAGTPPAGRVRLHILVEQLHRIQLRALAGQEVQLDPLGMSSNPGADQLGPMHGVAVHDQVDLPPAAIA